MVFGLLALRKRAAQRYYQIIKVCKKMNVWHRFSDIFCELPAVHVCRGKIFITLLLLHNELKRGNKSIFAGQYADFNFF